MPVDVIMPALGMAQETGKVLRWLKAEGETVVKGEPLVEVETDKVTVEVESPADGTLGPLRAAEGDDVPVGRPVAVVLADGETAGATSPEPAAVLAASAGTPSSAGLTAVRGVGVAERPAQARRRLASPKARRMAAERGLDIERLVGSGPNGAVLAADVDGAGQRRAERSEVGSVWRVMAERTTQSWQSVPHFYLHRAVDASRLQSWRGVARAKAGGESVTYTDLLVRVAAEALRRHPGVNASWRDGGIAVAQRVNIAIAVATDAGLVAPVIHDADRLELPAIAARRIELVENARAGRLRLEDVADGTFTISNLGMYGVDSFDAIVNAPQAAILAVGRMSDRIVPVDGRPAVRPVLELSASFDHRAVDGARGAEFVGTLAALLEEPAGLVG